MVLYVELGRYSNVCCTFLLLLFGAHTHAAVKKLSGWTDKTYPQLRSDGCGAFSTKNLCDPPPGILNQSDAAIIAGKLIEIANSTPCHCERQAQCFAQDPNSPPGASKAMRVGFVVGVALINHILLNSKPEDDEELTKTMKDFATTLGTKWALGDCGNAAIVLFWKEYTKLYIWTSDEITPDYLTDSDIAEAIEKAMPYFDRRQYREGLEVVLNAMLTEFLGSPKRPLDIGLLFLTLTIAVAVLVVCIIAGCVFAFRCCGNLNPEPNSVMGRTLSRVDSIRTEMMRRGGQLRRSFSRSPKFSRQQPPQTAFNEPSVVRDLPGPGEQGYSMV